MSKRAPKVHLDATKQGWALKAGLCGWVDVETTHDLVLVTCAACRKRAAAGVAAATRRTRAGDMGGDELGRELAAAFQRLLIPKAGPPPALTPGLWANSCKGGEHRRCGRCELCLWESEAERYEHTAPWRKEHRVRKPVGAPAWPSLAAALVALADWEHHARFAPSAMGPILDRAARGAVSDGGASRPEDPLLRRAAELVRVRQTLEAAYPEGAHPVLRRAQCMTLLLTRTPGVLAVVPKYEALAEELHVSIGDLRALVRSGRRFMTVELAARGLIPLPAPHAGLAEAVEEARGRMACS